MLGSLDQHHTSLCVAATSWNFRGWGTDYNLLSYLTTKNTIGDFTMILKICLGPIARFPLLLGCGPVVLCLAIEMQLTSIWTMAPVWSVQNKYCGKLYEAGIRLKYKMDFERRQHDMEFQSSGCIAHGWSEGTHDPLSLASASRTD